MSASSSFSSAASSPFISYLNSFFPVDEEEEICPQLVKEPLPISSEYDSIKEKFYSKVKMDRSDWLQRSLTENPEIEEYMERALPVARAAKFARLYLPNSRFISQKMLLSLISQHLRTLGLIETQASLLSEFEIDLDIPAYTKKSQLTFLIQRGILNAEKFWELTQGFSHLSPEERKNLLDEEISKTIGGAPKIDDIETDEKDSLPPVFDTNGKLRAATLTQLINLLTTNKEGEDYSDVESAFLLTYKSVVSSQQLFSKIRERFRICAKEDDKDGMMKCFSLLQHWIEKGGKEIEQPIIEAIKYLYEKDIKNLIPLPLFEDSTYSDKSSQEAKDYPPVELGQCASSLWTGTFKLTDLPPLELARQMTVWTALRYYSVERSELLNGSWQNPRLKHRAPNVVSIIDHTNIITKWVSTSIIIAPKVEERIKIMVYLLDVMHCLWEMQNCCDAYAILGGFVSNAVFRLESYFNQLPKKEKERFQKIYKIFTEGGSNMKLIREVHEQALKTDKPCIPYIGILLSDLFKYSDIEKNKIDGMLNITKCMKIFAFIESFEVFKKHKFNYLSIVQVQYKLDRLEYFEPSYLYDLSLEIYQESAEVF